MTHPSELYNALSEYNIPIWHRELQALDESMAILTRGNHQVPEDMRVSCYFLFPNGYGASIIRHNHSYGGRDGLFELAVIEGTNQKDWELVYDTPITDDVLGNLTLPEVLVEVERIRDLPPREVSL